MIMFASDLDQTLIFSNRFFEKHGKPHNINDLKVVEYINEKPISYTSDTVLRLLRELAKKVIFIPATTRTIDQFKRVMLIENEIAHKYAIASNGGNILVNGTVDADWNKKIRGKAICDSSPFYDIMKIIKEIDEYCKFVVSKNTADDLFHYYILDETRIPKDEIAKLTVELDKHNWNVSLQGRKLYFVPKCVDKGVALQYIVERESPHKLIASGDSNLDSSILQMAALGYIPNHGGLTNFDNFKHSDRFKITNSTGVEAAEELLQSILDMVNSDVLSQ